MVIFGKYFCSIARLDAGECVASTPPPTPKNKQKNYIGLTQQTPSCQISKRFGIYYYWSHITYNPIANKGCEYTVVFPPSVSRYCLPPYHNSFFSYLERLTLVCFHQIPHQLIYPSYGLSHLDFPPSDMSLRIAIHLTPETVPALASLIKTAVYSSQCRTILSSRQDGLMHQTLTTSSLPLPSAATGHRGVDGVFYRRKFIV